MKTVTKLKIIRFIAKILRYDQTKDYKPILIDVNKIQVVQNQFCVSDYDIMKSEGPKPLKERIEEETIQKLLDYLKFEKMIKVTWERGPERGHQTCKVIHHFIKPKA